MWWPGAVVIWTSVLVHPGITYSQSGLYLVATPGESCVRVNSNVTLTWTLATKPSKPGAISNTTTTSNSTQHILSEPAKIYHLNSGRLVALRQSNKTKYSRPYRGRSQLKWIDSEGRWSESPAGTTWVSVRLELTSVKVTDRGRYRAEVGDMCLPTPASSATLHVITDLNAQIDVIPSGSNAYVIVVTYTPSNHRANVNITYTGGHRAETNCTSPCTFGGVTFNVADVTVTSHVSMCGSSVTTRTSVTVEPGEVVDRTLAVVLGAVVVVVLLVACSVVAMCASVRCVTLQSGRLVCAAPPCCRRTQTQKGANSKQQTALVTVAGGQDMDGYEKERCNHGDRQGFDENDGDSARPLLKSSDQPPPQGDAGAADRPSVGNSANPQIPDVLLDTPPTQAPPKPIRRTKPGLNVPTSSALDPSAQSKPDQTKLGLNVPTSSAPDPSTQSIPDQTKPPLPIYKHQQTVTATHKSNPTETHSAKPALSDPKLAEPNEFKRKSDFKIGLGASPFYKTSKAVENSGEEVTQYKANPDTAEPTFTDPKVVEPKSAEIKVKSDFKITPAATPFYKSPEPVVNLDDVKKSFKAKPAAGSFYPNT